MSSHASMAHIHCSEGGVRQARRPSRLQYIGAAPRRRGHVTYLVNDLLPTSSQLLESLANSVDRSRALASKQMPSLSPPPLPPSSFSSSVYGWQAISGYTRPSPSRYSMEYLEYIVWQYYRLAGSIEAVVTTVVGPTPSIHESRQRWWRCLLLLPAVAMGTNVTRCYIAIADVDLVKQTRPPGPPTHSPTHRSRTFIKYEQQSPCLQNPRALLQISSTQQQLLKL